MVKTDYCISRILEKAESIFNGKIVNKETLGNSANMVFELLTQDNPIILRISEYTEYKERHVNFELSWLKYLSREITEVIRPILTEKGKLYEIISVGEKSYIVCAFEKAQGRSVNQNNPNEWNESLFYKLGTTMGSIHKNSTQYTFTDHEKLSFEWNKDFAFSSEFNLLNDSEVLKVWNKIICELEKLPKTEDSYGIIHNDLHHFNFFIDGDKIKVFDFDDCICSWYSFDIALTLFQFISTISYKEPQVRNVFAKKFIAPFLKGYKTQKSLESFWINKFDLFLRYRRICSYKFFNAMFSKEPINSHAKYLTWLRKEIIYDKPFISINFKKIYESL